MRSLSGFDLLRGFALWTLALLLLTVPALGQPLTAVVNHAGNLTIKLEPVATLAGFVPIDAATIPGDNKLYVGTYIASSASIRVVDPVAKTVSPTPFLTFAGTGVPITGQGLQGITFSPHFNDNTKAGYRKFYTYEQESSSAGANVMYRHPEVSNPGSVGVIREWTGNAGGTAIDTSIASRVVFNFGTPAGHMGGGMKFGPDGYLYLSTGDGGGNGDGHSGAITNATDGFTGRDPTGTSTDVPVISNGQDFTNALGKVIRIDPYVTNADGSPRATPAGATAKSFGGSTRYFIPGSNPFATNSQNIYFTPVGPVGSQTPVAPLAELYAFGFRNPWKLSFDKNAVPGDAPYVSDVGSHQREEILVVEPGNNYGWPYREGDVASTTAAARPLVSGNLPFLKQTSPGVYAPFDLDPTLSDPAQMSAAMAVLGTRSASNSGNLAFSDKPGGDLYGDGIYGNAWGDGNTVTGGFVYRGSAIAALQGMYVFGIYQFLIDDMTRDPSIYPATSGGGRLLYFDPNEVAASKTVREFNFESGFGIKTTPTPGFNSQGDLLSVSQGDDGELYAMFANGDIARIAAPTLAGDYNGDDVVDAADYTVWRDNFGSTNELPNDLIGGEIGSQQYDQWKANFGASNLGGSGAVTANVPEPGALALMILGILSSMASCRRRCVPRS